MDDVFTSAFPERRRFRIQLLGEDLWQPVERPVVVQELPNEGGGAAEAPGLFLEDRGLLWREAKGLGEVVVTARGFGHEQTPLSGLRNRVCESGRKAAEQVHDFIRIRRVVRHLKAWVLQLLGLVASMLQAACGGVEEVMELRKLGLRERNAVGGLRFLRRRSTSQKRSEVADGFIECERLDRN